MALAYIFNVFTGTFDAIDSGGSYWQDPVATFADLPTSDPDGSARIVRADDAVYAYDAGTSTWIFAGKIKLAAVGATPNTDGYSVSSDNTLTLQPADATHPGVITALTQTIGGNKTLSGTTTAATTIQNLIKDSSAVDSIDVTARTLKDTAGVTNLDYSQPNEVSVASSLIVPGVLYADGGIDVSVAGTLSIGGSPNSEIINIGNSGATVNIQGTTLYENVTQLQVADPIITLNVGGGPGSAANSGFELEENAVITGYVATSLDRNSWNFKAPNTAGIATITPGASGITIDQSSHNPVTVATLGASPNTSGASISGTQVLTLQPADGSNPGLITASTQTLGGAKTFSDTLTASQIIDSGLTANRAIYADGSKQLTSSTTSNTELSYVTGVTSPIQTQIDGKQPTGNYITALTGDVTAAGPGSVAATVAFVGTSAAADVHTAELLANAATNLNTVSTIVKRDASGDFTAGTITASINGSANGNLAKSLGDLDQMSFSAANNQAVAADVTGLTFSNTDVRAAKIMLSVYVNATASLYEFFELNVIQKTSGWDLSATSVGDISQFEFTITTAGQIQYTNGNYPVFSAATIKFRALTLST